MFADVVSPETAVHFSICQGLQPEAELAKIAVFQVKARAVTTRNNSARERGIQPGSKGVATVGLMLSPPQGDGHRAPGFGG